MSGTGRKHSSKWDLSDEHKFSPGSKQMRSGRSSADVAGSNSSEWAYLEGNDKLRPVTGFSSKESYYGGRGSNEDDAMNKDHRVFNSRREWDTDGSYSRNMRHSQSPKNDWSRNSRSRSRSPPRGFRWDSGVDGRKRTRVGGSTRPCRDFAVGKCRRGSHCNFLHHDNQNRENSWEGRHREDGAPRYSATHESVDHSLKSGRSNEACINFAKGSCRMGASCKFVHDYDSDGYGKVSMDEFTREREDEALRYPATHESRDHSLKSGRSNEFIRERGDGARRYPATHESRDHSLKSGRSNEFTRERENGGPRYPATYESRDHSPKNGRSNEFTSEREDGAPRYPTTHESRDYSLKSGRSNEFTSEREDGAPRYPTTHESRDYSLKSGRSNDEYGKVFMDEFTREREVGRRHRDNSFEHGGRHVPNRTIDAPCKFFASGNCRNGKHCRFSHDTQACRSPIRRSRDDRWTRNPSRDHQMLDRRKLSDSISPNKRLRDDRWGSDSDMADPDRVEDSPKRNDTVSGSDAAKLIENKSGNVGATEPEFTDLPITDGWGNGLDKSGLHVKPPILSDKKEADLWIAENTGANMHGSQSISTTGIWPGDAEMSPDWNYRMGSSSHMEEHKQKEHDVSQGGTYLAISEHNGIQLAPGQNINQNTDNVNPLHTSSYHAVAQSQVDVPILSSREGIVDAIHSQEVSTEQKYTGEPNIMDSGLSQVSSINPPVQNVVSNEQLAQLTNLSASLAHILGAGQQLPQLYAALNSHELKDSPSQAKTQVPAMPVSITCIKPDPAVELPKQYDPMNDSIEQKNADASDVPPAIPPSKTIAEVEILSQLSNPGRENFGNSIKGASSEHVKSDNLIHLQPGQNTVVNKDNNEEVAKERKNSQDGHKSTKENGPQNMDQNAGPDDAKQTKEMKGSRAFKFALAEFVKELLKPTWKEGKITKEDYKTIVKKVVDKVTGTIQEANIPQTQEKIDQYLSFSKPKLNKLVQAYVEKVQKG